jgi:hypothetical protein
MAHSIGWRCMLAHSMLGLTGLRFEARQSGQSDETHVRHIPFDPGETLRVDGISSLLRCASSREIHARRHKMGAAARAMLFGVDAMVAAFHEVFGPILGADVDGYSCLTACEASGYSEQPAQAWMLNRKQ